MLPVELVPRDCERAAMAVGGCIPVWLVCGDAVKPPLGERRPGNKLNYQYIQKIQHAIVTDTRIYSTLYWVARTRGALIAKRPRM